MSEVEAGQAADDGRASDQTRRRFLTAATSGISAVGVVGVAVPFMASWNPSEKAKAAGAPVKADISKIEPGQMVVVEWRGKPVYVLRRTPSKSQAFRASTIASKTQIQTALTSPLTSAVHLDRSTKSIWSLWVCARTWVARLNSDQKSVRRIWVAIAGWAVSSAPAMVLSLIWPDVSTKASLLRTT